MPKPRDYGFQITVNVAPIRRRRVSKMGIALTLASLALTLASGAISEYIARGTAQEAETPRA